PTASTRRRWPAMWVRTRCATSVWMGFCVPSAARAAITALPASPDSIPFPSRGGFRRRRRWYWYERARSTGMTTVLVVGSGGREHALAWKIQQSPAVERLYVAPGNAGTAGLAENVPVAASDVAALVRFVREREVDLTVIGPEAPLALGL